LTDSSVEYRGMLEDGDTAMCEAVFTARRIAGDGIVLPLMAVAVMKDGLIVRFREYFDPTALRGGAS